MIISYLLLAFCLVIVAMGYYWDQQATQTERQLLVLQEMEALKAAERKQNPPVVVGAPESILWNGVQVVISKYVPDHEAIYAVPYAYMNQATFDAMKNTWHEESARTL